MRRFASGLLNPFNELRLQALSFRCRTPTSHENAEETREQDAQCDAVTDFSEGKRRTKPSAVSITPCARIMKALIGSPQRERLHRLLGFQICLTTIEFTSTDSHKNGGQADVAQATYRPDNRGDGQVVAVKMLRYHRDIERKKFDNVRSDYIYLRRSCLQNTKEFVHQVEVMAGLSHENVVQLIGFVEDLENGTAWIVVSWEPNGNLSEFLAKGDWEIPERISLVSDSPP